MADATCSGLPVEIAADDGSQPLAGFLVGVTSQRNAAALGGALGRLGAQIRYAPAMQVIDPADDPQLRESTARCLRTPPAAVIVTSARGVRAWVRAAGAERRRLDKVLGSAALVARGRDVRAELARLGHDPDWTANSSSWAELMVYLSAHDLIAGRTVAVQCDGEPPQGLLAALRTQGAEVIEVQAYRWAPPEDDRPLRRLIGAVSANGVDAVTFTSPAASVNFLRTADRLGLLADVTAALRTTVLSAGVGPLTARPLTDAGIPVAMPASPRLGELVAVLLDLVPRRAPLLRVAGHDLEVRSSLTVVDKVPVTLPAGSMALLRELARKPGQVLSRETLAALLPGEGGDGHTVEVAIARLRGALGDPAMVQTVVKRGYRLSVDGGGVA